MPIETQDVSGIEASFRAGYTEVYGRAPSNLTPEVLNWHLIAELPRSTFHLAEAEQHERDHDAWLGKGFDRSISRSLSADSTRRRSTTATGSSQALAFDGPAIIEEQEATIVVPPGCDVRIDGYRNVIITLSRQEASA